MSSPHQKFGLFGHSTNTKVHAPNAMIFSAGDEGRVMYAIKRGSVAILLEGKTASTLGEEEVFGEMALLDHAPRAASAMAIEETELVEIDEAQFLFLVRQNPYFALQMMRLLSERLRGSNALYKGSASGDA